MLNNTYNKNYLIKKSLPLLHIMYFFLAVNISGCSYVWLPPHVDQIVFEPAPQEKRIINAPTIKLISRKDAVEFCSKITGIPIKLNQKPMACSYWNKIRQECTIVVPLQTMTNYIGHEIRHCFEGAYH